jgi:8-oxo-dGTP pyrophosphatase MutT (NUDIX family)
VTDSYINQTRLRVGGIWQVEQHILLESLRDIEIWGVPGGGIEPGETAIEACQREFKEELALDIMCERPLFTTENIWLKQNPEAGAAPVRVREYAFYFQVRPVQSFSEARPILQSVESHLKFAWFSVAQLPQLHFVPPFMADVLQSPQMQPPLIVNRQDG